MCDRLVHYGEARRFLAERLGSDAAAKRVIKERRVPCLEPAVHGLHKQKLWRLRELEGFVEGLGAGPSFAKASAGRSKGMD